MSQHATEFLPEPVSQNKSYFRLAGRLLKRVFAMLVGSLMCLTPVSAILVLGWFSQNCRQRVIRTILRQGFEFVEDVEIMSRGHSLNWILGSRNEPSTSRFWPRILGGIKRNSVIGLRTYFVLIVGTLPFTLLWLFSWWAGWENSFNKGYEQAWVGPATGIVATILALYLLNFMPLAFVHCALFDKWRSYFDIQTLAQIRRMAGWRYVGLVFLTVLLSLPLFAAKTLPVFIEQIYPDFMEWDERQLEEFKNQVRLAIAAYIFLSLWFLKGMASRIYAQAIVRVLTRSPDHGLSGFPLVKRVSHNGDVGQSRQKMKVIGYVSRIVQWDCDLCPLVCICCTDLRSTVPKS